MKYIAPLAAALIAIAACSSPTTATSSPIEAVGIDLPTMHAVGAAPDDANRAVITVSTSGELTLDGEPIDLTELPAAIRDRAPVENEQASEVRNIDVVIAADAATEWREVQWALQACADPVARVARTYFAVQSSDGTTGTFALFLPVDGSCLPDPDRLHEQPARVTARVRADSGERDPWRFVEPLRAAGAANAAGAVLEIDAAESTPMQFVMTICDVAHAADIDVVTLVGTPPPGFDLLDRPDSSPTATRVTFRGLTPSPVAYAPPPATALDGIVGFTENSVTFLEDEIEFLEEE